MKWNLNSEFLSNHASYYLFGQLNQIKIQREYNEYSILNDWLEYIFIHNTVVNVLKDLVA